MTASEAATRARAELTRAAHRAQDRTVFYRAAAAAVQRVVPLDGSCWIILDPATLLFTHHFSDDLPTEGFHRVCHNEYAEEDVNKFATLTRSIRGVATLDDATGGHPERSTRHRTILAPSGLSGELRASFVDGTTSWGCAIFLRRSDRPAFTAAEVDFVSSVAGVIGHGFRTALLPTLLDTSDAASGTGVVVLGDSGRPEAVTPAARRWIDELRSGEPPNDTQLTTADAPLQLPAAAASRRAAPKHRSGNELSRST